MGRPKCGKWVRYCAENPSVGKAQSRVLRNNARTTIGKKPTELYCKFQDVDIRFVRTAGEELVCWG